MTTPSPLTRTEHVREFKNIYKFLRHKMPTNLLIPLGTKNPLYKHARGKWNWELLNKHYKQRGIQVDEGVGLLLIDLAVLDLTLYRRCIIGRLSGLCSTMFPWRPLARANIISSCAHLCVTSWALKMVHSVKQQTSSPSLLQAQQVQSCL